MIKYTVSDMSFRLPLLVLSETKQLENTNQFTSTGPVPHIEHIL